MSRVKVVFDEQGEIVEYALKRPLTDAEVRRLGKAISLAPTLEICESLLRGESVPIDRLDREQVACFGRRP